MRVDYTTLTRVEEIYNISSRIQVFAEISPNQTRVLKSKLLSSKKVFFKLCSCSCQ